MVDFAEFLFRARRFLAEIPAVFQGEATRQRANRRQKAPKNGVEGNPMAERAFGAETGEGRAGAGRASSLARHGGSR